MVMQPKSAMTAGLFLGFLLGVCFVRLVDISLDIMWKTAQMEMKVDTLTEKAESRGDAAAVESKGS